MCGEGDAHAEEGAKSLAFWEVNKYCLIREKKKATWHVILQHGGACQNYSQNRLANFLCRRSNSKSLDFMGQKSLAATQLCPGV